MDEEEESLAEFSRHGRDERFSDGRMVVLLLVGAVVLFMILVVVVSVWIAL